MEYGSVLTLDGVRELDLHRAAVVELGDRLPDDDAGLDELLEAAVAGRDAESFVRLVFAAIARGRPVDARHLVAGSSLLDDPAHLVAAAWHCTGDVPAALIAAIERGGLRGEPKVTALLAAAAWCRERGDGSFPHELLARARSVARLSLGIPTVTLLLLALADLVDDDALGSTLAPYRVPGDLDVVRRLREEILDPPRHSPLSTIPDTAPPATLTGYTVRRAVPRIGRNEPCPCGSGKKYKRCCHAKDQARLQRSSDIPGVTVDEIKSRPEDYLARQHIDAMRPHELVRLDPTKVPRELLPAVIDRLVLVDEDEAVTRIFEAVGYHDSLEGGWDEAVHWATSRGREDIVGRLVAVRPGIPRDDGKNLGLGTRLLLAQDAGTALHMIEAEALATFQESEYATMVDLAHGLLHSRYPALGLMIARGALPLSNAWDAEVLLDVYLEVRDRLGLAPEDAIEDILTRNGLLEHAETPDHDENAAELRSLRESLESSGQETRRLHREIAELQSALAAKKAEPAPTVEAGPKRPPAEPPPEHPALDAARHKLRGLQEQLKERHRERNQLRRELADARRALDSMGEAGAGEHGAEGDARDEEETHLLEGETGPADSDVRIPIFAARFREAMGKLPAPVTRAAVQMAGRLAAGDPSAFRGVRRLRHDRQVMRQRVGISHRLLFRLEPTTLEVLALVHRADLERTIRSL